MVGVVAAREPTVLRVPCPEGLRIDRLLFGATIHAPDAVVQNKPSDAIGCKTASAPELSRKPYAMTRYAGGHRLGQAYESDLTPIDAVSSLRQVSGIAAVSPLR